MTAVLVIGRSAASAATLFSNLGQSSNGFEVALMDTANYSVATDFLTGNSATTITSTSLALSNVDSIAHHYTVSLYTDGGGVVGTLLGTFTPVTVPHGPNTALYTATSSGINLAPNTAYWEVLEVNEGWSATMGPTGWVSTNLSSTDAGSVFTTIPATQDQSSEDGGSTWVTGGTFTPYYSLASVPEPSSILSLGICAALLSMLRWRSTPE